MTAPRKDIAYLYNAEIHLNATHLMELSVQEDAGFFEVDESEGT